ncbi:MAG: tRNA (5-methylaminomethyl-2-thiouridine)(34)-methyltransferase MnmD [Kordiimonadaceae bacterium]|jgi:tRNA 5-methylaminomethyl-2-thiouridine biosynthesis bifunctional protein|nr:tRNA (5-methylaminomethyl-2-thiouridine)(34)-methyltransferase MnmD [Kordiimonadaceae bacterium]MBT6030938.1 tRNA (5-methylaminomethyl-2-thiouridine)(34)-methyltransferase MnmD [Kordiimonadaceae bacterium]
MSRDKIFWQDDGSPRSQIYDDIYFSPENGLEESQEVFLNGIGAPEVWDGKDQFTIYELGFGTGLNFLLTMKLWLQNSSENQTLMYFATEMHPLSKVEMNKAVHWPELKYLKDEFLTQYPAKDVSLCNGRIRFHLLIGDSGECLRQSHVKADAWYLDGFAPAKNPDMWSDDIFKQMARLSNQDAKVATFTSAGFVRRGLSAVNFKMSKRKGYGKKREMLCGKY